MLSSPHENYQRIAQAIEYVRAHFQEQPSLETLAAHVHLSPHHFQRLFTEWAGTSPKKFLQYTTIAHAKTLLKEKGATLFDAAAETGLSGTGRLHDLFITIEGMTPAEYKNGGKNLLIHYRFADNLFGKLIVASTPKGICYMAFEADEATALDALHKRFPAARIVQKEEAMQQAALQFFEKDITAPASIKLHLRGTPFQLKVWEALLKIPSGQLTTYGALAAQTGHQSAFRAIGTAIGSNPVAYLIPCHRVIQSGGALGGYRWGATRKAAMIGWESAQQEA